MIQQRAMQAALLLYVAAISVAQFTCCLLLVVLPSCSDEAFMLVCQPGCDEPGHPLSACPGYAVRSPMLPLHRPGIFLPQQVPQRRARRRHTKDTTCMHSPQNLGAWNRLQDLMPNSQSSGKYRLTPAVPGISQCRPL